MKNPNDLAWTYGDLVNLFRHFLNKTSLPTREDTVSFVSNMFDDADQHAFNPRME